MLQKPVWGPNPEFVSNDKLNQMTDYAEQFAAQLLDDAGNPESGQAPTGAAGQVYATPATAAGPATLRPLTGSDLPTGTTLIKGALQLAADGNATTGRAVQATDTRLSNARTPTSHTHAPGDILNLTEWLQDAIAQFFTAGSGISFTYDDAANTFTVVNSAPLSAESVQDIVGAMAVSGSNVTATYDDAAGTLTIAASGGGSGGVSSEEVQDIVAALLTAGTNVTLNYNDAAGTLTVTAVGSAGVTQAELDAAIATRAPQTIFANSFEAAPDPTTLENGTLVAFRTAQI